MDLEHTVPAQPASSRSGPSDKALRQAVERIGHKDLEKRKNWYSPVAKAYNTTRPKYPRELITKVVEAAQLSATSRILELGCGPGTATTSFAELGCQMVCLEPNQVFCELARANCQSHPKVEVIHTSFEEWELEPEAFDAVLAASSMHWITPETGYAKASRALKENGHLILLWNKEMRPCEAIQKALSSAYQLHAPLLGNYEDSQAQEAILAGLGQMMLDSGWLQNLATETLEAFFSYTPEQYLSLLSTYSPYMKLEQIKRTTLFYALRECLAEKSIDTIPLSCLSAYHMAQKKSFSSPQGQSGPILNM
ncbi:MAG: class I SAM-dependent methyltransferase [Prochlorococcaceae cyanobacterium]|jgi:SAM-dependent methyltransferase